MYKTQSEQVIENTRFWQIGCVTEQLFVTKQMIVYTLQRTTHMQNALSKLDLRFDTLLNKLANPTTYIHLDLKVRCHLPIIWGIIGTTIVLGRKLDSFCRIIRPIIVQDLFLLQQLGTLFESCGK